ncbi:gp53-like domain-containing protein [Pseudomonas fluorescens]
MGVVWNFGANGYLALPSWLGGVIIQWGQQTAQVGTAIAANAYPFPMAFPNQIFRIIGDRASEMQNSNNPSTAHYFTANTINWSVTHVRASGSVAIPFVYLAIGR